MDITEEFKKREFVNWFIIASLKGIDITDVVKSEPRIVTMQINGVEINPLNAIKRLEKEFDHQIQKEVDMRFESLKADILNPIDDEITDMLSDLRKLIDNKVKGKNND